MNVMDALWSHYRRRPFVPFVIALKDGQRILIHRPLQFAFNENVVSVFIDESDRRATFKPSDIAQFEELHPVG